MGLRERTLAKVQRVRAPEGGTDEPAEEVLSGRIGTEEATAHQERFWNALKQVQEDGDVEDFAFQTELEIPNGLWGPGAKADFMVVGARSVPVILEDLAYPDKRKPLDQIVNRELGRRGYDPIVRVNVDLLESPEAALEVVGRVARGEWT